MVVKATIQIPATAAHVRPPNPSWLDRAKQIAARATSPIGKPWGLVAASKKSEPAKLYIYDAIGKDPWSGTGIDPMDVVKQLAEAKGQDLEIHINSPGGYVFDGIAIFNALRQHEGKKTVHVDALAASIASVIALAGDKVITHEGAQWMVHDPWGGVWAVGTADEIEKAAGLTVKALRQCREAILDVYVTETGRSVSELSALMTAETWMSAEDALARGFTDEVERTTKDEPENPEDEKRAAAASLSPEAQADLARARARALSERFPGASPGQPGQPGANAVPAHRSKP